ncbi:phage distal tail protein [Streptomyces sp. NPDC001828]|uniref:phage distal tail protein n=1 Tax=Streptomyces sp. NPDC001828 TaxID=3364615 RepID=UPI0036829740
MTASLSDFQHDLGGLLIGAGTPISIANVEGLGRAPVRTGDVDPPHEDGTWLGADYYSGRTIRIDAAIKTPGDPAAALDILAMLERLHDDPALRLTGGATTALRLKLPGREVRVVYGRLRKVDADFERLVHGWVPLDIEVLTADQLFYADRQDQLVLPLRTVVGGGFTAPVVAPIVVTPAPGDAARPGWITVEGTASTWPVLRIDGPCANPVITHVETGHALRLDTVIGRDDWVEIDTRPTWRSVLRRDGGSVPLTGGRLDVFSLPPGRSEIRWQATDPSNQARLTVTWRPAWPTL